MLMIDGARALDRARGRLFGTVGRWPVMQAVARRRSLRLGIVAAASIALAFAGTMAWPLLLLGVAPVVLGVPHLIADVRYLLVRRAAIAPRAHPPLAVAAVACTVAAALGDVALTLVLGAAGVALAALCGAGEARRRLLVVALAAAAAVAAWRSPRLAALTIGQAHNFIAVAVAAWLMRRSWRLWWLPLALLGAGTAAIAAGALDGSLGAALPALTDGGISHASTIATGAMTSTLTLRLVGIFIFAQAVHYAVWLRLVPDAERAGERPIGYRHSLRLLREDFGRVTPLLLAVAVAVPLAACLNVAVTRDAYFTVATFHGYLELAFAAALFSASPLPSRA
jgi:hypothetical protein